MASGPYRDWVLKRTLQNVETEKAFPGAGGEDSVQEKWCEHHEHVNCT